MQSINEVKVVNRFVHATAALISVQDADAGAAWGTMYVLYRALVQMIINLNCMEPLRRAIILRNDMIGFLPHAHGILQGLFRY